MRREWTSRRELIARAKVLACLAWADVRFLMRLLAAIAWGTDNSRNAALDAIITRQESTPEGAWR